MEDTADSASSVNACTVPPADVPAVANFRYSVGKACPATHPAYQPIFQAADDGLEVETQATHCDFPQTNASATASLLQILRSQVAALSADNQRLQTQCSRLQCENQQLHGLVTDMYDVAREQRQHAQVLLHLHRQHALRTGAASQDTAVVAVPDQHHAAASSDAQPRYQTQRSQAVQFADCAWSGEGCDAMQCVAGVSPSDAILDEQLSEQQDEQPAEELSVALPRLSARLPQQQQQQGHLESSQQRQQQQRVTEWLDQGGWQQWQEQLPLQPRPETEASAPFMLMGFEEGVYGIWHEASNPSPSSCDT